MGKAVHMYKGHNDAVRCMSITQDGHVYSGSFDHSVRRWDIDAVAKKIQQEEIIRKQMEEEKAKEAAEKKAAKKGGKKSGKKKKGGKKKK